MKDNKLTIIINRPAQEVFDFTLDPHNTPKWIDGIEVEEANEWPVKVGSIYRNKTYGGAWAQYKLTELIDGKAFTLVGITDANYAVRYTFTDLGNSSTKFEYYEWVEQPPLTDPFGQEALEKLKSILEV